MHTDYPLKIVIQKIISQKDIKKSEWQAYYDDAVHSELCAHGETPAEALLNLQEKLHEKSLKDLQKFVNIFNYRLEKTT